MMKLFLSLMIITTSAFTSTRIFGRRQCRDMPKLSLEKGGTNEDPIVLEKDSIIILPVFPLQKSVRLPTESLRLNLYEERYLAMSEFILEQDLPVFGALYASDKPQIVKGGQGPIVPMIDVGDIGVLCFVKDWEDGMVPTRYPSFTTRRIRLNALAVSRFRIEEIVNDGTMSPQSKDPSFIIVKASLVTDNNSSENVPTKEQISRTKDDLRRRIEAKSSIVESDNESAERIVDEISSIVSYKDYGKDDQRSEIFSFVAASMLCPESESPVLRTSLLQVVSTEERLRQISEWS
jgi:Lon protease-like protein